MHHGSRLGIDAKSYNEGFDEGYRQGIALEQKRIISLLHKRGIHIDIREEKRDEEIENND